MDLHAIQTALKYLTFEAQNIVRAYVAITISNCGDLFTYDRYYLILRGVFKHSVYS